jgi:hypothetical protein
MVIKTACNELCQGITFNFFASPHCCFEPLRSAELTDVDNNDEGPMITVQLDFYGKLAVFVMLRRFLRSQRLAVNTDHPET